jgi:hypothetical protein
MRFIFWFIFFGILFYAIWFYSPETFKTMVSWAAKAFTYIKDWVEQLTGKSTTPTPPQPAPPAAALLTFLKLRSDR